MRGNILPVRVACGVWHVACGVWRVACGVCEECNLSVLMLGVKGSIYISSF